MRKPVTEQRWNLHYNDIVLSTNPIAYWPLDEKAGTVAWDWVSGRVAGAQNGAHTGVTLGAPGIGDGMTAPFYDGALDNTNIYSAALNAVFNGQLGSCAVWARVLNAAVWTDATSRMILYLRVDDNNRMILQRTAVNNRIQISYTAAGTAELCQINGLSTTDWMHLVVTWSKAADQVIYYYAGLPVETDTTLGAWAGNLALDTCVIGGNSVSANTQPWNGYIAHPALWNRALTAGEVEMLYKARY